MNTIFWDVNLHFQLRPEDGGSKFISNAGKFLPDYKSHIPGYSILHSNLSKNLNLTRLFKLKSLMMHKRIYSISHISYCMLTIMILINTVMVKILIFHTWTKSKENQFKTKFQTFKKNSMQYSIYIYIYISELQRQ